MSAGWIRRNGARDEEAFLEAIHAEHAGALMAYLVRLTRDRQRAEDLLQETLLRAWRRADELTGDARSLRPWLFTVARNLAHDARRAPRERREVTVATLPPAPDAQDLDRALEAWQVIEALAALSAEHRSVIVETYFRGRSVAEAARALGVPTGTVKSRAYYGLRALRLALEERGWGA
ncbi:MAG: polymerase sigma-70 factor, subfamily [Miltoncostaeaceae bacterium]|jgi:RNA polymerase sigma-70 factor (ECF subfamily)|nr:polymerase sigma-70 factor, subfamily [Miltoncostaeaceae bacterium]